MYRKKYVMTKNKIREYDYSIPISEKKVARQNYKKSADGVKQKISLHRTRNNIVTTIDSNANKYSKFITLTTTSPCLDRDDFLKKFAAFKKQFQRLFGENLKYIGVLERQKKRGLKENNLGSIHIHLVVFNSKKLDFDVLKRCWTSGSVDVKLVDFTANLGVYMAKYISKDNISDFHKHLILKSKGLKKPLEIRGGVDLDLVPVDWVKSYETKYLVGYVTLDKSVVGECVLSEYIIPQVKK